MKISQLSVLALLTLTASGAFAQSGVPGGPPPGFNGPPPGAFNGAPSGASNGGGGTTDASSVTNVGSALATDPTTSDVTTPTLTGSTAKGELANTGGEPELMLLAGLALASGGLLLRRKVGSQSA